MGFFVKHEILQHLQLQMKRTFVPFRIWCYWNHKLSRAWKLSTFFCKNFVKSTILMLNYYVHVRCFHDFFASKSKFRVFHTAALNEKIFRQLNHLVLLISTTLQKRCFHEMFAKKCEWIPNCVHRAHSSQCGNVGNLPPLQNSFVKSIYSTTL